MNLPPPGGHLLMGSDAPESFGFRVTQGNNIYIAIHPDTREDADKYFNALSSGGIIEMPMKDQFWGDYYGSFTDKFGIRWMVIHTPRK